MSAVGFVVVGPSHHLASLGEAEEVGAVLVDHDRVIHQRDLVIVLKELLCRCKLEEAHGTA
jgi:hypothetical protein